MKCSVVLCDYWWFSFGTIHNHGSSVGHCEARISPGSGIVKGTIVEVGLGLVHLVLHDNFRVVEGGPFLSLSSFSMFFAERGHHHE